MTANIGNWHVLQIAMEDIGWPEIHLTGLTDFKSLTEVLFPWRKSKDSL